MAKKLIKLGYFSLPENTPRDFPRTFLVLDEDNKIRIGDTEGPEISRVQFARSLARGDITLTKEGENFVKRVKL